VKQQISNGKYNSLAQGIKEKFTRVITLHFYHHGPKPLIQIIKLANVTLQNITIILT
jgi:hypothetical protein